MNRLEIASYIDHTNLKTNITRSEVMKLINECKKYKFAALCISPGWVSLAKKQLAGTGIEVSTVPNWASGGGIPRVKSDFVFVEADSIDYIWDLHRFCIQKDYDNTAKELEKIRLETRGTLKIIIESTVIRAICNEKGGNFEEQMKKACELVQASGANFIKTDSGLFVRNPAKGVADLYEEVGLMKQFCTLPIKAAGGIRDLKTVEVLINIGVTRVGSSSGVKIMEEVKDEVAL